ncbi:hypothetical protein ABK040_016232 [Willaertia magna]
MNNINLIESNANNNIKYLTQVVSFFVYLQNDRTTNKRPVGIIDKDAIIYQVNQYICKIRRNQGQRSYAFDLLPILTTTPKVALLPQDSKTFVKAVTGVQQQFSKTFCYETVSGWCKDFTKLFDKDIRKGMKQIELLEEEIPKKASKNELLEYKYVLKDTGMTPQKVDKVTSSSVDNNTKAIHSKGINKPQKTRSPKLLSQQSIKNE